MSQTLSHSVCVCVWVSLSLFRFARVAEDRIILQKKMKKKKKKNDNKKAGYITMHKMLLDECVCARLKCERVPLLHECHNSDSFNNIFHIFSLFLSLSLSL